jgi:predicted transcriptional regulator
MRYRNKFAIASSILQAAQVGNATKTRLMYGAFLSFAQINEYLNFLTANGLIRKDPSTKIYALTEKGQNFLHVYKELSLLVPLDEEEIPEMPPIVQ